jgi:hypothetical protein
VVIFTTYRDSVVNRRFWPMYHALQIIVVVTLYEQRLPPLVIWFTQWVRDIVQLNVIPRKYLTRMLSVKFFRVLFNAGGMLFLFSIPVFLAVWGITSCVKVTTNKATKFRKFCTELHSILTFDGLIRLYYINFLPLCVAAGIGRHFGSQNVEAYPNLLVIILLPLLLLLVKGIYGKEKENAWSALYSLFWLLRRVLFAGCMRVSFFIVRLSLYLGLQIGVFSYYGMMP